MPYLRAFMAVLGLAVSGSAAEVLQSFSLQDHLGHAWSSELIHFPFDIAGTEENLILTDGSHSPVLCQFSEVKRDAAIGRVRGSVWTVVTLGPGEKKVFHLERGQGMAASSLRIQRLGEDFILANERLAVRLPDWSVPGKVQVDLVKFLPPIAALRSSQGEWLGRGQWVNEGRPLSIKETACTILEKGPVRVRVRQYLKLDDGTFYEADIELAAGQDMVLVTERSIINAREAGFRFSLVPGLQTNRVLWNNQWKETAHAKSYALTTTRVDFPSRTMVCRLRPWSFWWLGDVTMWAGFYREGADPFVGIVALRPSRWSPGSWDGFDLTEIPITAGPEGRLDLTFPLVAQKEKAVPGPELAAPLCRHWGLTVGSTRDHLANTDSIKPRTSPTPTKLRRQLIQYSEFPLDEVKEYAFDFKPARTGQAHPFLLFSRADIERVRRQARTIPVFQQTGEAARRYILQAAGGERTLRKEGWQAGKYGVRRKTVGCLFAGRPAYICHWAPGRTGTTLTPITFNRKPFQPRMNTDKHG